MMEDLPTQSGKPRNIKQHNRRLVLSLLQRGGVQSVAELAQTLNMSKTTALKIVAGLCESGIVLSAGKGSSTNEGGKKPELFALNADYRYGVAISLARPGELVCCVLDYYGDIRHTETKTLPLDITYDALVDSMSQMVTRVMVAAAVTADKLFGIAVACDAIVDTAQGRVLHAKYPDWPSNVPLRQDLADSLPFACPVFIDNISRFAGYAELLANVDHQAGELLTIWCDNQAGGSILSGRQMVQGVNGIAGNFGHIMVDPGSTYVCPVCGRGGCLESIVARASVLAYARTIAPLHPGSLLAAMALAGTLEMEDVFRDETDPMARALTDRVLAALSAVIYNLASLTLQSADTIILQGMYTRAGRAFLERLNELVHGFNRFDVYKDVRIVYSGYRQERSGFYHEPFIRGAAFYMINQHMSALTPE